MSITFTITCDTEAELAYVLDNLKLDVKGDAPSLRAVAQGKAKARVAANGKTKKGRRRQAGLSPLLEAELGKVIAAKKPFRSKDVIDRVMKQHPDLKVSSVTTGVNKLLSQSSLKFETIKNPVGRSYKQYLPK